MQELLAQIGEHAVLLTLTAVTRGTAWRVFRNIDECGFDFLLLGPRGEERRVEVKTRQRLWTTSHEGNRRTAHFTVTEVERRYADFVVCYWWERGWMFVVPTRDLVRASARGKYLYKFVVTARKGDDLPAGDAASYLERWSQIAKPLRDGLPFRGSRNLCQ